MKDQLAHWNNAHKEQWLHAHSAKQTAFAEEVNAIIPPHAAVLELGCGEGNDSFYFAQQGHTVTATDFSDVVIAQNQKRWTHDKLKFLVQDMSKPLRAADKSFDVVYARLSLHYFTNQITQQIFAETARVLKPNGQLHFMCKEVSDPIYGKGEKIEDDMYELDGHVRHFFSEKYVAALLATHGLKGTRVETGKEIIYDRTSAFIKVAAEKQ